MAKLKSYSKAQTKKIEEYWEHLGGLTDRYYEEVSRLEKSLSMATGITDIEFFKGEGQGFVGVGNASRTYKLWQEKR